MKSSSMLAGTSVALSQGQLRHLSPCLKNCRPTSVLRLKAFNQPVSMANTARNSRDLRVLARSAAQQEEEEPANFAGALCTLVLGSVLLGERLNGEGLVHALELHNDMMHPILLAAVAGLLAAALWPEQNEAPKPSVSWMRKIAGRVAYLGLAGTIIAEMFTGKGALALLDIETGVEALSDVEGVIAFMTMLVLTGQGKKQEK